MNIKEYGWLWIVISIVVLAVFLLGASMITKSTNGFLATKNYDTCMNYKLNIQEESFDKEFYCGCIERSKNLYLNKDFKRIYEEEFEREDCKKWEKEKDN